MFPGDEGEKGAEAYETVLVHKDGTRIEVEINADSIPYENRLADLVFIRDIRGQKQLEEERLKRSKLESIGMLAGGIAHDFNNILGVILGYIDLGKLGLSPGSPHSDKLSKAEQAIMKARDLAQQFLTFSEGGAPVKRVTSIREIVEKGVEDALDHPELNLKNINHQLGRDLKIDIPVDLWRVNCDPDQIKQVISNLVINAVEAMHAKLIPAVSGSSDTGRAGELIVITSENAMVESQEIGYLQAGKYIRLSVRDQGEGIKKEDLSKIFDPYFSTRQRFSQKGLGLGLTIVYSIVKRHDGHIEVTSQMGKGTTVTLYLPVRTGKQTSPKPERTLSSV